MKQYLKYWCSPGFPGSPSNALPALDPGCNPIKMLMNFFKYFPPLWSTACTSSHSRSNAKNRELWLRVNFAQNFSPPDRNIHIYKTDEKQIRIVDLFCYAICQPAVMPCRYVTPAELSLWTKISKIVQKLAMLFFQKKVECKTIIIKLYYL